MWVLRKLKEKHYWFWFWLTLTFDLAILAIIIWALIILVGILTSESTCQLNGTC